MELLLPSEAKTIADRVSELGNKEYRNKYNLKIYKIAGDGVDKIKRENTRLSRVYGGGVERIIGHRDLKDKRLVRAELIIDELGIMYFDYDIPVNNKKL
jgi:hypothetical protein